jgi:pimeloyl-ACP methyl ester carboxylesterase
MNPTAAVAGFTLNALSRVSGGLAGAGAFSFFHMPFTRSKARGEEREVMAAAQVARIPVNGRQAVTYRWGDGSRPVLLVHGWQSRGSRMSGFVPALLDQGFSVLAFDVPGHGDATGRSTTILDYRDTVRALHDQYGPFEALIAHSLGVLGSFYALANGAEAKRVVTISGVCDFAYPLREFTSTLRLRPQLTAALQARIAQKLFPGRPAELTPFSVTHGVGVVSSPLLVIHDEDDTRIEVAQGRRLAGAYGDQARLMTTTGLGHRRILTDPDVVTAVLTFVTESAGDTDRERGTQRTA